MILAPSSIVSGRFAYWLLQNLDRKVRERQRDDDEIEASMLDLALTAEAWRRGRIAEQSRTEVNVPPRPLTTSHVAAMHRVHEASVRRAIRAGRLRAEQGRHGWEIARTDAEEWRPRKAREEGRAA